MPVTAVARQAGSLDTEDRADTAGTHLGNQPCKARAINLSGTGAPKVFVDNLNFLEAELASLIGQSVLPPLALKVAGDLNRR
jgi:hypothetical protein